MAREKRCAQLIAKMVEALRESGNITRADVAAAFLAVPRMCSFRASRLDDAYPFDKVIPTHFDDAGLSISSSSAPNIMATMLEQLDVQPGMRVLEIGAGTGYNAGLLAHLRVERGKWSASISIRMSQRKRVNISARSRESRTRVWCKATVGSARPTAAPFDRVEATVGAWEISPHWFAQLRPGGVLVMPLWLRPSVQVSVGLVRDEDRLVQPQRVPLRVHASARTDAGPMPTCGPRVGQIGVDGATPEKQWIAAIENATPERVAVLQRADTRARRCGAGTHARDRAGRRAWRSRSRGRSRCRAGTPSGTSPSACSTPERHSLALFDAGRSCRSVTRTARNASTRAFPNSRRSTCERSRSRRFAIPRARCRARGCSSARTWILSYGNERPDCAWP